MGYDVSCSGSFRIREADLDKVGAALRAHIDDLVREPKNTEDVTELLLTFSEGGMFAYKDGFIDVPIYSDGNGEDDDVLIALEHIKPYLVSFSMECEGEDGDRWRQELKNGQFEGETAQIMYGSDIDKIAHDAFVLVRELTELYHKEHKTRTHVPKCVKNADEFLSMSAIQAALKNNQ